MTRHCDEIKTNDTPLKLPHNVEYIISTLEAAGYEAFVVGGCVRDIIRGTAPKDWDIATSAVPAETKALFSHTVDTGIKHGTVTVLRGKEHCEVTTYRIDGDYLDNRRPETVTFANKIEEDLSRRDFTINAIAYNPGRGFIDPFGGYGDIENGVIRCVGDAKTRFGEDALRMLRAIRFAAVLGFSVDNEALNAIAELKSNLVNVSAERIREELVKLLCGAYPKAAKLLETTGILKYVLCGNTYGGDLDTVLRWAERENYDATMRISLFLLNSDCKKILCDLRFDNKTIKLVSLFCELIPKKIPKCRYEIKKILRIISIGNFEKLVELKKIAKPSPFLDEIRLEARDIIAKGECFTLCDLAVNGNDLANAGIPPGKTMGDTLEKLLDAVMREPSINKKEILLCRLL